MAPSPGMSCTHTVRAWAAGEDLHAARSPPRVSHRALLTTGSLPPAHTPTPTSASQIQAGHLPGWLQPQVFVTCSSTSTSICLHPPCILPCIQLPDWTPPHIPTHASSIRGGCPDLEVDGEEAVRERGKNLCKKMMKRNRSLNDLLDGM
ncbi:uncharacterized protein LOC133044772 isoform X4 [Dama dama]|uniref:uncharacterized protein LOC133044772 isoform X4 n=1 Tax=Dama dama TaxID=30532 RepID=UPI002A371A96|nr:uncharacterized protein LOC133044772 isoform X4 [Dama dama]